MFHNRNGEELYRGVCENCELEYFKCCSAYVCCNIGNMEMYELFQKPLLIRAIDAQD
jgi:hypothetical protein